MPQRVGSRRSIGRGTLAYVAAVTVVGLGLTTVAVVREQLSFDQNLTILLVLTALASLFRHVVIENQVRTSLSSTLLLAAITLSGPGGAGVVGLAAGWLQIGKLPLRARMFNAGHSATGGVVAGYVYLSLGGRLDATDIENAWTAFSRLGGPLLMASLVQWLINNLLLSGVIRISEGIPMRATAAGLVRRNGLNYLGYGPIAIVLTLLWESAQLGPASVLLVLAPLLVARWAHVQHADEVRGRERALRVLAAAVEAKVPHLVGHSARVADLSERMAAHLGLRSQLVTEARVAGMLHDLGKTTLPTDVVRGNADGTDDAFASYPQRGVALLGDLDFLSGSLDAIGWHREAVFAGSAGVSPRGPLAAVVGVADQFDLLTEANSPTSFKFSPATAVAHLRDRGVDEHVLRALEWAIEHRSLGDQR
jgi:HD-GYP domain-containing protein (c-di-GMP phosphodiesterase class II)